MIISFQTTLEEIEQANNRDLSYVIGEVLRAHVQGYHLLVLERSIAKWIAENLDLTDWDRVTVQAIGRQYTQNGHVVRDAAFHLCVKPMSMAGMIVHDNRVEVGLRDIDWPVICSPTILLSEDSSHDGTIYLDILKAAAKRYGSYTVNYDLQHGGGTGVYKIWSQRVAEKRAVCLIADSDLRYPTDVRNRKIPEAISFAQANEWPFVKAKCLPCREIENMIPLEIVGELPCGKAKPKEFDGLRTIGSVETLSRKPDSERFYLYYDLKNGFNKENIDDLNDNEMKSFYQEKRGNAGKNCTFEGFGENIIRHILDDAAIFNKLIKYVLNEQWWNLFKDVFEPVLWLGYAPNRQLIR